MALHRNQVWTDETREVVRRSWEAGSDEIEIAFAVNEELERLHSAAGHPGWLLTSPRGVLYQAHEIGLLSDAERDRRLEVTRSSSWQRDYSSRRKAKGLTRPSHQNVLTVRDIGSVPLGGSGETAERFDSAITGPIWVTGLRLQGGFAVLGWRDPDRFGEAIPLTDAALLLYEDFDTAFQTLSAVGWKKHGCRKLRAFLHFLVTGETSYDGFTVEVVRVDSVSPSDGSS